MTVSPSPSASPLPQLSALSLPMLKALKADLDRQNTEDEAKRLFYAMYPDQDETWTLHGNKHFAAGPTVYRRSLHPKHLEFFRAGAKYRERCFMAANRVSKTLGGGGYETACHLTGEEPHWW